MRRVAKYKFYTNVISQASKAVAAWLFTAGLALIGFGLMIYLLPRLFATIAAIVFFAGGMGLVITAAKIFLAQRKLNKLGRDNSQDYRKNVQIHTEEHYDV